MGTREDLIHFSIWNSVILGHQRPLMLLCVQSFHICLSEQKQHVTSLQWGDILVQFLKSFLFLFLPNVAVHCLTATSAYTLWDIDQVLLTTPCFSEVYRLESLPSWVKRNMHENENNWPNNCFSCRAPRISSCRPESTEQVPEGFVVLWTIQFICNYLW